MGFFPEQRLKIELISQWTTINFSSTCDSSCEKKFHKLRDHCLDDDGHKSYKISVVNLPVRCKLQVWEDLNSPGNNKIVMSQRR